LLELGDGKVGCGVGAEAIDWADSIIFNEVVRSRFVRPLDGRGSSALLLCFLWHTLYVHFGK
jgi:hypothetical protein